ncbi:hypothetical protein [Arcanobacterium canis]
MNRDPEKRNDKRPQISDPTGTVELAFQGHFARFSNFGAEIG